MNENSTRRKDKFNKTENNKSTSKTRNQSHAKVLAVKDKFYRDNSDMSSESSYQVAKIAQNFKERYS